MLRRLFVVIVERVSCSFEEDPTDNVPGDHIEVVTASDGQGVFEAQIFTRGTNRNDHISDDVPRSDEGDVIRAESDDRTASLLEEDRDSSEVGVE